MIEEPNIAQSPRMLAKFVANFLQTRHFAAEKLAAQAWQPEI